MDEKDAQTVQCNGFPNRTTREAHKPAKARYAFKAKSWSITSRGPAHCGS